MRDCASCRYAEREYCEGVGPGYPRGFWSVCGCNVPDSRISYVYKYAEEPISEEWNDEWGDTIDCPFWEDADEYDSL